VTPVAAAVSRLWVCGRSASAVVWLTRGERAATAWSASMSVETATAVPRTRRPARGISGAVTAAAITACCTGSV
jgi:hypothetical protein